MATRSRAVSDPIAHRMRLCFLVDYRSPIARNWIAHFSSRHEVHVLSTFPVDAADRGLASFHVVPVAFGALATHPGARRYFAATASGPSRSGTRTVAHRVASVGASVVREILPWIAPLDVARYAGRVRAIVRDLAPDLVHAMRIPYEGMLGARALEGSEIPLMMSVWGNDFTLFASRYPLTGRATRRALARVDVLHTDCQRDLRLARRWGWDPRRPGIVLPGSGGVQPELFYPGPASQATRERWSVPAGRPVIFNPRGFRPGYVRTDVFFAAMERLLSENAGPIIMCAAMAGNPVAEDWRTRLGPRAGSVRLLPAVDRPTMAELFRLADITVSPSTHDGSPNTLLEGMACGAFPVAGNIESVREWIEDGRNGILCNPTRPDDLLHAVQRALADPARRERAARDNQVLIANRADYHTVMSTAERCYEAMITARSGAIALPHPQPI